MLKSLKLKFVLISLGMAFLVLTLLVAVSVSSAVSEYRESYEYALAQEMSRGNNSSLPHFTLNDPGKQVSEPYSASMSLCFSVNRQEDGSWALQTPWVTVAEDTLQALIDQALAAPERRGMLSDYDVAYQKTGSRISFVSLQADKAALDQTIFIWLVSYVCAMLAFLVLCIFLARWALRPVEKAWRQQQQFIADASHEIKTPLTVILANTDIMEQEQGASQWLSSTRSEAEHMKGLVENMLFLARSDAVKTPPPQTPVALTDLCWECVLAFEAVAFERDVTLESRLEPNCAAVGDAQQLRHLLEILLDNAVKYTPEGGGVQVSLTAQKKDRLTLAVQNSGPVIPHEQLQHLFDRFYRADETRSREVGGYGLGLAIAKEIVQSHHGQLSVSSDEIRGTVFTVSLPQA